MHKAIRLSILFFLLNSTSLLKAQWRDVSFPVKFGLRTITLYENQAIYAYNPNTIYRSINKGRTFDSIEIGQRGGGIQGIGCVGKDSIYAITVDYLKKRIWYTYNGGITWDSLFIINNGDTAFSKKEPLKFIIFDKVNWLIYGSVVNGITEVYLTNNAGKTWQKNNDSSILSAPITNSSAQSLQPEVFRSHAFFYDPAKPKSIYRLTQFGKKWQLLPINLEGLSITSLSMVDSLIGYSFMSISGQSRRILAKTINGGETWDTLGIDVPCASCRLYWIKESATRPSFLYTRSSFSNPQSYISYDIGKNWIKADTLRHGSISFYDADFGVSLLFVDQFNSNLRVWDPDYVGLPKMHNQEKFMEVYPNPANTFIQLDPSIVSATIYSATGQKLEIPLIFGKLDLSQLPNGIYFVGGINQKGNRMTQKIIVQHE